MPCAPPATRSSSTWPSPGRAERRSARCATTGSPPRPTRPRCERSSSPWTRPPPRSGPCRWATSRRPAPPWRSPPPPPIRSAPASFVVILAPIAGRFGLGGLLLATLMAGLLLMAMGLARMGRLIEFVPHPVTTGFTSGIALVIGTLQIKDLLGLSVPEMPEHFTEKVVALALALPTGQLADLLIGLLTLTVLFAWRKVTERVPAALAALLIAGGAAALMARLIPGFHVATIGSRFQYVIDGVARHGIPPLPPLPVLPWRMPGPDGRPLALTFDLVRTLAPSAFAIAMLGAIESLLSRWWPTA